MSKNKIGKKILENLTRGMYEDSRIIYREYIQNSAYQIFTSIANSTFEEELFVDIKIDVAGRNIYIKDNATGIPRDLVAEKLSNVADSDKDEEIGLGFRGIGRLGGLAYCSKLRFITSAVGDDKMTIMEWNADELNRILDDKNIKDDATEVLSRIIEYDYEPCGIDEHFFTVELLGISEDNTDLLSVDRVREYISENAPVPYDTNKFFYNNDIHSFINEKGLPKNEYRIFVNGEDLVKPYSTSIFKKGKSGGKEKRDDIYGIKMHEFYNDKNELLAWMWYGISKFEGVIEYPLNRMAGIRLRQSNIQIGNERTLSPRFKDSKRGNMYFIGEIHAVHKGLTPNARRDYFNENETSKELESELEYFFHESLYSLYYFASNVRSATRKELNYFNKQSSLEKKQGKFINDKERKKLEKDVEAAAEERNKALKDLEKYKAKTQDNEVLGVVFKKIEDNHTRILSDNGYLSISSKEDSKEVKIPVPPEPRKKKIGFLTEELTWLPKSEQKLVSKIYAVISQNLPPDRSEELISKIQEELKHGKKDTSN